jgi:hypothetical protein
MKFRVGFDFLDRVEFQGYVAGRVSVQYQFFAVGFDDGSGEAVAIFQSDLVGK